MRADFTKPRTARTLRAFAALFALAASGGVARAHEEGSFKVPPPRAPVRSVREYVVPDVRLVRDDGKTVSLREELDDGRPVVVNFVFTTCTTICPLMSQAFARLQAKLGAERDRVHLVSISIDPEEDTPERLRAYAGRYRAGPEWRHYTGSAQASAAVQKAFGAFRGDKMNHTPVTFLRAAPGRSWVRVDGFASPDELLHQLHQLVASAG